MDYVAGYLAADDPARIIDQIPKYVTQRLEAVDDSDPPPLRPAEQGQDLGPVDFQALKAGMVEACEIQRNEERSYVIPPQLDPPGR